MRLHQWNSIVKNVKRDKERMKNCLRNSYLFNDCLIRFLWESKGKIESIIFHFSFQYLLLMFNSTHSYTLISQIECERETYDILPAPEDQNNFFVIFFSVIVQYIHVTSKRIIFSISIIMFFFFWFLFQRYFWMRYPNASIIESFRSTHLFSLIEPLTHFMFYNFSSCFVQFHLQRNKLLSDITIIRCRHREYRIFFFHLFHSFFEMLFSKSLSWNFIHLYIQRIETRTHIL